MELVSEGARLASEEREWIGLRDTGREELLVAVMAERELVEDSWAATKAGDWNWRR